MRRFPSSERGYALATTVWLLMLAASIAAAITLVHHRADRHSRDELAEVQQVYALQSAIDQVRADRQFFGRRSQWWSLSASRNIEVDGRDAPVEVENELARIDINEAPLEAIETALVDAGVTKTDNGELRRELIRLRREQTPVRSMRGLSDTGVSIHCLEELFSGSGGVRSAREATDHRADATYRLTVSLDDLSLVQIYGPSGLRASFQRPTSAVCA